MPATGHFDRPNVVVVHFVVAHRQYLRLFPVGLQEPCQFRFILCAHSITLRHQTREIGVWEIGEITVRSTLSHSNRTQFP